MTTIKSKINPCKATAPLQKMMTLDLAIRWLARALQARNMQRLKGVPKRKNRHIPEAPWTCRIPRSQELGMVCLETLLQNSVSRLIVAISWFSIWLLLQGYECTY